MSWSSNAACRDLDRDPFVVPSGPVTTAPSRDNERALAVCRRCPVAAECLAAANAARDGYTIRGGLLPSHPDRVTGDGLCLEGLDVDAAARRYDVTPKTIRERIRRGDLEAHKTVDDGHVRWCVHPA